MPQLQRYKQTRIFHLLEIVSPLLYLCFCQHHRSLFLWGIVQVYSNTDLDVLNTEVDRTVLRGGTQHLLKAAEILHEKYIVSDKAWSDQCPALASHSSNEFDAGARRCACMWCHSAGKASMGKILDT